MDAAEVVEWHFKPGDRVKRGDIIVSVETDKGILDVEIFESGVLEEIMVRDGRVTVGTVLARVRSDTEATGPAAPSAASETPKTPVPAAAVALAPAAPAPPPAGAPDHRVHVSPAARRRASELGLQIDRLQGSGPHGVVTLEDVERAAAKPKAPSMRGAIAAAMTRSKREIPHYYLGTTIDLKRASDWLAARNLERPVTERLVMAVLLIKAVALALRQAPEFNGWHVDGAFRPGSGIHVGVAVSLRQGGLVAPALHDTDRLDLDALMRSFLDLVTRARSGRLRATEMADGTITVTSLGDRGVETLFPVIYPPQVAIIGFGTVGKRAVVTADDAIAVHPCVEATLAADHRVSDGHRGGLFLAAVREHLQQPETL